jgi:hypothetical protein
MAGIANMRKFLKYSATANRPASCVTRVPNCVSIIHSHQNSTNPGRAQSRGQFDRREATGGGDVHHVDVGNRRPRFVEGSTSSVTKALATDESIRRTLCHDRFSQTWPDLPPA